MKNNGLYKNKYRIESARMKGWDYSSDGYYFVTIVTKNREHFFGMVEPQDFINTSAGKMKLSRVGDIAKKYWMEIPVHFPYIRLDEFIVMPNHVHGIINIDKSGYKKALYVSTANAIGNTNVTENETVKTTNLGVSTVSSKNENNIHWKPGNLGVIINQYKRICTIQSRKINSDFAWQSRFHDHIVRDDNELKRIQEYIVNNPANWENDNPREVTP